MNTYHLLGGTGLRVSPLALGTMTFGQRDWGCDAGTARAVFDRYLETGGNHIDTAGIYADGRAEELLGTFIHDAGARERIVLATKYTLGPPEHANAVGNGRKAMLASLDASLRRLRTDYIDLFWMHAWDAVTPLEEVLSTFDALVRSGKVRAVGMSNVPAWYAARAHTVAVERGLEPLAALQLEYSLLEREIERELLPAARQLGIGTVAYSPLGGGFLSGKYRRTTDDLAGDGRLDGEAMRQGRAMLGWGERPWAIMGTLREVAEQVDRTPAQVALNWVANRPGVASAIVGARDVAQWEANSSALDFALSDGQRDRLDAASALPLVKQYMMTDPDNVAAHLTPGMTLRRV